jgi:SAM-dependent methyltransferase
MKQQAIFEGYAADAHDLVPRFEALQTEDVLAPVLDLLPPRPGKVLDVGAGTGRDAAWLTKRGHRVLAVEPVSELRQAGQALHDKSGIEWLDDSLPLLRRTKALGETFDLILSVAVWQHLPPDQHRVAIATLSSLTALGGRLILSVRHGPGAPNRVCFAADTDHLVAAAKDNRLGLLARRRAGSVQLRNQRAGVTWDWLCFDRCA